MASSHTFADDIDSVNHLNIIGSQSDVDDSEFNVEVENMILRRCRPNVQ
jgi:hypothetical protein